MSEELAIEILKQANIEADVGGCEKCPRKDKNKTCIGCLEKAKEIVLDNLQQKENIIKKVREFVEEWKYKDGDGSVYFDINTNPDDLLRILDKGE